MRKAVLIALAAFSVIVTVLAQPSSAAAKPAYKVTLGTSVAKSTAGAFLKVAGKVTGPKAAGKTVAIQRRYETGGWVTVASAVVRPNGTYAARVETPRGGTTAFRAVKGASKVRKAGVSAARAIPVYEWLYLANEGYNLGTGFVMTPRDVQIGGTQYGRSMEFNDGDTTIGYSVAGLCTSFTTRAAYSVPGVGTPDEMAFNVVTTSTGGNEVTTGADITTGSPVTVTRSLTGIRYLQLEMHSLDSSYFFALGNPRVLCNADHLPSVSSV